MTETSYLIKLINDWRSDSEKVIQLLENIDIDNFIELMNINEDLLNNNLNFFMTQLLFCDNFYECLENLITSLVSLYSLVIFFKAFRIIKRD